MKKNGVLLLIFCFSLIGWGAARIIASIQFNQNCEGYLKRAADANTVELAKKQLEIALKYIEDKKLTSGYTSIMYKTPDEDVGFWYENIKNSIRELNALGPDATPLEKSNMLIKLRETLIDHGEKDKVTVPEGIEIYPDNEAFALWAAMSLLLAMLGFFLA